LTNGAGTPSREEHRAYFEGQLASNREFWRRFGRMPAVAGRRVFDFGCGHGALSVELARAGADVYGVDIDTERIVFARDNLRERYPDVADRVRFDAAPIAHVQPDQSFDLAVSKDTFEHVSEIGAVGRLFASLLEPYGRPPPNRASADTARRPAARGGPQRGWPLPRAPRPQPRRHWAQRHDALRVSRADESSGVPVCVGRVQPGRQAAPSAHGPAAADPATRTVCDGQRVRDSGASYTDGRASRIEGLADG
jgi:SAM-dependent methyltransferase